MVIPSADSTRDRLRFPRPREEKRRNFEMFPLLRDSPVLSSTTRPTAGFAPRVRCAASIPARSLLTMLVSTIPAPLYFQSVVQSSSADRECTHQRSPLCSRRGDLPLFLFRTHQSDIRASDLPRKSSQMVTSLQNQCTEPTRGPRCPPHVITRWISIIRGSRPNSLISRSPNSSKDTIPLF